MTQRHDGEHDAELAASPRTELYAQWLRHLAENRRVPDNLRAAAEPLDGLGRELDRLTRVLDVREQRLAVLLHIVRAVGNGRTLPEVLDHIYAAFRSVIPYDRIAAAFVTEDGTHVRSFWVHSELGGVRLKTGYTQRLADSSLARILATGAPRIINDLEAYLAAKPESQATRLIVAEGGRSSLTCPLTVEGRPIGVLFFTSAQAHTYTTAHTELFSVIADQVAHVVETSRIADQLRQRERELRESNDELTALPDTHKALIDALPAHIALLDDEGTIVDVNERWRQFGLANAYVGTDLGVGRNYLQVCDEAVGPGSEEARAAADGVRAVLNGKRMTFNLEYPCHGPDQAQWFRLMVNRLPEPNAAPGHGHALAMHLDITERKLGEIQMLRSAYEDRLTGLWSRNGFVAELEARIRRGVDHAASMVIVLDIIALRDINEAHGYERGDAVLHRIAERLGEATGPDGLVGRIAGDEFGLLVPVSRAAGAGPKAMRARIAAAFDAPIETGVATIQVAARLGYTRLGGRRRDAATALREAELALFQLRDGMGMGWQQYTQALDAEVQGRIQLTQELRAALARDEFEVHFQPQVDLATGRITSSEALVRWFHPERGLQSPAQFMPVAEKSQLIGPIGDLVLRKACRALRAWRAAGLAVVRVSVNVSLVQFQLGNFPERVYRILAAENVTADDLALEITETVFADASDDLRQQLQALHDMGLRLSLDDFGTGYSSLSYLQQYPFDEIKVDKAFVQGMDRDSYSREIVRAVIGITRAAGADAVAEGVETVAQRQALMALGAHIGQGFYYSMPLAEEDYRWLLEHRRPLPLTSTPDPQDATGGHG